VRAVAAELCRRLEELVGEFLDLDLIPRGG
jgi:hypothetical protein